MKSKDKSDVDVGRDEGKILLELLNSLGGRWDVPLEKLEDAGWEAFVRRTKRAEAATLRIKLRELADGLERKRSVQLRDGAESRAKTIFHQVLERTSLTAEITAAEDAAVPEGPAGSLWPNLVSRTIPLEILLELRPGDVPKLLAVRGTLTWKTRETASGTVDGTVEFDPRDSVFRPLVDLATTLLEPPETLPAFVVDGSSNGFCGGSSFPFRIRGVFAGGLIAEPGLRSPIAHRPSESRPGRA